MNPTDLISPDLLALLAQAAEAPEKPEVPFLLNLLPWVAIFGVIYFLFFRPITKAKKEQEQMVSTLKTGAKVTTVGGLVGIITNVKDNSVMIRCGDAKLEILKEKLASVDAGKAKDKGEDKDTTALEDSEGEASGEDDNTGEDDDSNSNSSGNKPYNRSRKRRGTRR